MMVITSVIISFVTFVTVVVILTIRQARRDNAAKAAAKAVREEAIARRNGAIEKMSSRFYELARQLTPPSTIVSELESIGSQAKFSGPDLRSIMADAWRRVAIGSYEYLADFPKAGSVIVGISEYLGLDANERGENEGGKLARYAEKVKCLEALYLGSPVEIPGAQTQVFINLRTNEKLLWLEEAAYLGYTTETTIEGIEHTAGEYAGRGTFGGSASHGAISGDSSTAGHYIDTTTTHQRVIQQENIRQLDIGHIGVTDQQIYFVGKGRHRFRHSYDQMVSIDANTEELIIVPDERDARPKVFRIGDGEFLHRMTLILSRSTP